MSSLWNCFSPEKAWSVRLPGGTRAKQAQGVDGRVDVGQVVLAGRQLAVGVQVPLAQQQQQLLLGEVWVDAGGPSGTHVGQARVPGEEGGITPTCRATLSTSRLTGDCHFPVALRCALTSGGSGSLASPLTQSGMT